MYRLRVCENGILKRIFGPKVRKSQANEENFTMGSFLIYTPINIISDEI
jgi:hypothetical protein